VRGHADDAGHPAAAHADGAHPVLRRECAGRPGRERPANRDLRGRLRRPGAAVPDPGRPVLRAGPGPDPGGQGAAAGGHGHRPVRADAGHRGLPAGRRRGGPGPVRARRRPADAVPLRGTAHLPGPAHARPVPVRARLVRRAGQHAGRQPGGARREPAHRAGRRGGQRAAASGPDRAVADDFARTGPAEPAPEHRVARSADRRRRRPGGKRPRGPDPAGHRAARATRSGREPGRPDGTVTGSAGRSDGPSRRATRLSAR